MVSNLKKCPNCPQIMPCAIKLCKACGAEQPKKARLNKRLQALDRKKGEWLGNLKKNHNEAAMKDEAIILLEKLHAMGYKPLLLLQKEGKGKKKPAITSLTPRCELDSLATQHLNKMVAFYELVCAGWKASEDTVLTLTLTPCDEQGTSGEAGPDTVEAGPEAEGLVEAGPDVEGLVEAGPDVEGLVEAGPEAEGLVEKGPDAEGLVEAGPDAEGLVEAGPDAEGLVEAGPEAEGLVEAGPEDEGLVEAGPDVEGLVEAGPDVEGLVEAGPEAEGLMEAGPDVEGLVEAGPDDALPKKGSTRKRKRKSEAEMDKSKKKQKNCSYHTGLGVFPIRSALRERVRKALLLYNGGETVEWPKKKTQDDKNVPVDNGLVVVVVPLLPHATFSTGLSNQTAC
ncbi:unnamed protein product [Leuciscus chuanchicus]